LTLVRSEVFCECVVRRIERLAPAVVAVLAQRPFELENIALGSPNPIAIGTPPPYEAVVGARAKLTDDISPLVAVLS
jgi:hypothetical protein